MKPNKSPWDEIRLSKKKALEQKAVKDGHLSPSDLYKQSVEKRLLNKDSDDDWEDYLDSQYPE